MVQHLTPVIAVDEEKCVNCHVCISACPVKFCNNGSENSVVIDHDLCIGCGACITACSHGARSIVDDFDSFYKSLEQHERIVAIVAPSVASNFPHTYLHLNGWLKSQGVEAIFDISFGGELAARNYTAFLHNNKPEMIISQPCSAVVTFIEIYHPELIPYLIPVDSPMIHTIKMIRQFYPQYRQHKIVMISPCVAKKREMEAVGMGDYNVVFSSLHAYFKKKHIDLKEYPAVDYDGPVPERAVLFPSPGGLLRTIKRDLQDISRYTRQIAGVQRVYRYLLGLPRALARGRAPLLVDCLSCENGCNAGPGSLNVDLCVDEVDFYIEERKEMQCNYYSMSPEQASNNDDIHAVIDAYWDERLYVREYNDLSDNNRLCLPDELEKKAIYKQMYKQSEEDFLNCAACGYGRCEDMVVAIYNGLNKAENCHRYRGVRLDIERKLAQEESEKARQLAQEAERSHQEVLELMSVRQDNEIRKKVEQELRDKYEILDSILQNMPIMMVATDYKGRIAYWNRECQQITGYSSDEMVLNPQALTVLYPDHTYLEHIIWEREEEVHAVRGHETQLTCKDGTQRTILWYDVSRDHPIPGWSQWRFGVDLTERKDMEAQLDRLNAVGEMAASIAHEIRNPMTTVRGFLQLLYETHDGNNNDREFFPIMIEELDRANDIITEYLSIASNKAIELQRHNLNSIISALYPIMLADAMFSEKNLDLQLSETPPILGDHTELRQLIINLVSNGLEAMSAKGTLRIRTFAIKDQVVLEVEDEGVGISPQHLAQIYTPFFTTKENGTGLGLSVCYSIATRHGAKWSVDSKPGRTIFSVRFPAAESITTG